GSIPLALVYRVYYKVVTNVLHINSIAQSEPGQTILFQSDPSKSNIQVPRAIKWSEVQLPDSWKLTNVTPSQPVQNTHFDTIIQSVDGDV
ncbi:hypothetical protein DVA76_18530, partial [Acinetobacter baumannii]